MQVQILPLRIMIRARCRFAQVSVVKSMISSQVLLLQQKVMRKWKCIRKKWRKWCLTTCHSVQGLVGYQQNSNFKPILLKIKWLWSQVTRLICSCIKIAIVANPLNKFQSLMAPFKSVILLDLKMDQFSKPLTSMSRNCRVKHLNKCK